MMHFRPFHFELHSVTCISRSWWQRSQLRRPTPELTRLCSLSGSDRAPVDSARREYYSKHPKTFASGFSSLGIRNMPPSPGFNQQTPEITGSMGLKGFLSCVLIHCREITQLETAARDIHDMEAGTSLKTWELLLASDHPSSAKPTSRLVHHSLHVKRAVDMAVGAICIFRKSQDALPNPGLHGLGDLSLGLSVPTRRDSELDSILAALEQNNPEDAAAASPASAAAAGNPRKRQQEANIAAILAALQGTDSADAAVAAGQGSADKRADDAELASILDALKANNPEDAAEAGNVLP
ncbi:hypothetical protein PG994_006875 [Apiospora phragmitis]|uniref:Uncharacterized protein n=1 Tax=Apiospora phragmitis TaxID=2905665 RepID=A0ABR1VG96_9PEZI